MDRFAKLERSKRFDMKRVPTRQLQILRPVTWLLSYPVVWLRRLKVNRMRMEGLKPPYLLLSTHHAFIDFMVTTAAIFPHRANYVVAIDGFIGREWLLRMVGGICKRKFTNDLQLVRQIQRVIKNGDVLALYPEARYSLIGTTAILPDSLGKLVKILKVPVVVLNMHGNYLNSPCWNLKKRGNRLEADITQILDADEVKTTSVVEINRKIREAFEYDEYRWQRENSVVIDKPWRAEGLHKVLYQCPHCLTEYQMKSHGSHIWCNSCEKVWYMDTLGGLEAIKGEEELLTEFPHIPNWYEFQRDQIREEVESGEYFNEMDVVIEALPNARGYIPLGRGRLRHDMEGFILEGENDFKLSIPAPSLYSLHIEYNYKGKGDCIDLSTLDDTFYIYPQGSEWSVTKMAIATEELFAYHQEEINLSRLSQLPLN